MKSFGLRAAQKPYFLIGLGGLVLIWLGQVLSVNRAMTQVIPQLGWQVSTGIVLLALLLFQWALFYHRLTRNAAATRRHHVLHKYSGLAVVVVFALHAARTGYGWTLLLFFAFVAVVVTGLLNREIMRYRKEWLYQVWLWLHISLSAVLMPLVMIHAIVALAYE